MNSLTVIAVCQVVQTIVLVMAAIGLLSVLMRGQKIMKEVGKMTADLTDKISKHVDEDNEGDDWKRGIS